MKSQKTEAHRKQIKMREKSGRTGGKLSLFNFTSMKEDTPLVLATGSIHCASRGARFTCSLLSSGDPKFPNVHGFMPTV
jgi:hypothetical protein